MQVSFGISQDPKPVTAPAGNVLIDTPRDLGISEAMQIIDTSISLEAIVAMARNRFGNMVKAVVDVDREVMALDGELHSDEEALLLESGSRQENLWGINIYPELPKAERIEFDSIINIRPSRNNRTRGVDDPAVRAKITNIVLRLISG